MHTIEGYEWSRSKAKENFWKHGVDFAEATTVLSDEHALTVEDESAGERRFVTIGSSATAQILLVVYAWRELKVRIISARKATPRERTAYEAYEYERHERGVRLQRRRARPRRADVPGEDPDHHPAG
ncbi:MAG TPA: BrnT family toxin [Thermoanaerobaculia bacterium]|nr:BrnT family toxin [Thermoanaerobaculia bacterium]